MMVGPDEKNPAITRIVLDVKNTEPTLKQELDIFKGLYDKIEEEEEEEKRGLTTSNLGSYNLDDSINGPQQNVHVNSLHSLQSKKMSMNKYKLPFNPKYGTKYQLPIPSQQKLQVGQPQNSQSESTDPAQGRGNLQTTSHNEGQLTVNRGLPTRGTPPVMGCKRGFPVNRISPTRGTSVINQGLPTRGTPPVMGCKRGFPVNRISPSRGTSVINQGLPTRGTPPGRGLPAVTQIQSMRGGPPGIGRKMAPSPPLPTPQHKALPQNNVQPSANSMKVQPRPIKFTLKVRAVSMLVPPVASQQSQPSFSGFSSSCTLPFMITKKVVSPKNKN